MNLLYTSEDKACQPILRSKISRLIKSVKTKFGLNLTTDQLDEAEDDEFKPVVVDLDRKLLSFNDD